jgi:hypothetical protein
VCEIVLIKETGRGVSLKLREGAGRCGMAESQELLARDNVGNRMLMTFTGNLFHTIIDLFHIHAQSHQAVSHEYQGLQATSYYISLRHGAAV